MAVSIITKSPYAQKQRLLILVDILMLLCITGFIHLAWYRFSLSAFSEAFAERLYLPVALSIAVLLLLFYVFDLYNIRTYYAMSGRLVRIIFSVFIATGAFMILSYFLPKSFVIRNVFILEIPVLILAVYFWREFFYHHILKKHRQSNVLIFGGDPLNLSLLEEIAHDEFADFRVVCIMPALSDSKMVSQSIPMRYRDLICDNRKLEEMINEYEVEVVIFSLQALRQFNGELLHIHSKGIQVFDAMTFYQLVSARVPIVNIEAATISITSGRFPLSSFYKNIKRLIDIALSAFGLIISAPFVIISAIMVQLEAPGPVFFRPERVGENGRILRLLKLRTMRYGGNGQHGPLFTQENDSRVTRIGGLIRKFGFDEFPQLFNVLRGELSLIGPRPIERVFVDDYSQKNPLYYLRTSVKPGISGWAQVNQVEYPNSERTQLVKLQYDLFYIAYASLFLDIIIVLKTVKKFFSLGYDNRKKKKQAPPAGVKIPAATVNESIPLPDRATWN